MMHSFIQIPYHYFRGEIVKETNAIKLLRKKSALRKTRIEQQDVKIKKLRHLLAAAEKTKNALNVQCGAIEAEVSSDYIYIYALN